MTLRSLQQTSRQRKRFDCSVLPCAKTSRCCQRNNVAEASLQKLWRRRSSPGQCRQRRHCKTAGKHCPKRHRSAKSSKLCTLAEGLELTVQTGGREAGEEFYVLATRLR